MLRAYSGMPTDEFIAQLRTYVIAMNLGPAVVNCVDDLANTHDGNDDHAEELRILEKDHETELERVDNEAAARGRLEMREKTIETVNGWAENAARDMVALIKEIEV